jgi:hypothetical protein
MLETYLSDKCIRFIKKTRRRRDHRTIMAAPTANEAKAIVQIDHSDT